MSKEIITKVPREKGFDYSVDKEGNVIKSTYNWFKDRSTLVVIVLLLLGGLYYFEMSNSTTNEKNFDKYCAEYYPLRQDFILNNPGLTPDFKKVMEYYEDNKLRINEFLNISPNG